MGLNAYVSGNYAKAEEYFRKLEQSEPNSIRVLRNLGVILLAQGKGKEAERYLLKEEKLYGPSFYRHAALADLAYATGNRKDAARRYQRALKDPECAEGGKRFICVHSSKSASQYAKMNRPLPRREKLWSYFIMQRNCGNKAPMKKQYRHSLNPFLSMTLIGLRSTMLLRSISIC